MQYAILCYHSESAVESLTQEQDDALMKRLLALQDDLNREGITGPAARLMPTSAAVTLRHSGKPLVLDGPFAETKEALLGLYFVECPSLEAALEVGKRLLEPRIEAGLMTALEIRPVRLFVDPHASG